MLFNRASRSLFNGAARRFKSTSAGESAGEQASVFVASAMGTTFATYMMADFLSNFLQHPTQKVCWLYDNSTMPKINCLDNNKHLTCLFVLHTQPINE
jgi:hypothetical protein